MRFILFVSLILCNLLYASSSYLNIDHQTPEQVIIGEILQLEISNLNTDQIIYDARVFYRTQGMGDFKSITLKQEGYMFSAGIPTEKMEAGNLEYYFAFETAGTINYFPDESPDLNPFNVSLLPYASAPQQETGGGMEILLLSPDIEETISPDEFIIAISLPINPDDMNNYRFSLELGGVDQSNLIELEGNLLMFSPKMIRGGLHNAEFRVFDQNNQMVGEKSFSFQISGAPSVSKGLNTRTSVFANNRYHNISESSNNLFRGGLNHFSSYQKFDFLALVLVSSEDSYDRQPINQYGAQVRYNFTPTMNLYLKAGDFSTNYDKLVFWEKRVRGIGVGYNSKFFELDFTYGQTKKAVEGKIYNGTTQLNGTFKQSFMGIQPVFKYADYFKWGFNLVNGKDDPNSIDLGGNPKESLVVGTTIGLNLHSNKIQFLGSVQASMKNEDAIGEVDFDTLADRYDLEGSDKDDAETLFDLLDNTGFLTLSQGLSPLPSLAVRFQTRLKYLNQVFQFTYKNIDADYTTHGNPYLMKDVRGFYINDKVRLIRNQLFLNLYFNSYEDRISQGDSKTSNTQYGATIAYYPFKNLPGISLTYGNHLRENEFAKNNTHPDSTFRLIEDNETQRLNLASSYKFLTAGIKNTISIGVSNFKRTDNIYVDEFSDRSSQSNFNIYTIGLRNQFTFPLISKISFSKSASVFGKDANERKTDINKFFLGLNYKLKQIFLNGDLNPYINYTFNSINTTTVDYSRINYSMGLNFRTVQYGVFSLRFDYIDYGSVYNWSDTILSTGYEINF